MIDKKIAVFYSWQSYIGGYANRGYIRDKILSAFKELNVEIELLEDARGITGAPDIPDAILTKIIKSDIFICDITSVYTLDIKGNKKRANPNPNVMFELGFAVRSLGWDRVICNRMASNIFGPTEEPKNRGPWDQTKAVRLDSLLLSTILTMRFGGHCL